MAIATLLNWTGVILISLLYPTIYDGIGDWKSWLLFAFFSIIGIIVIIIKVKETRNKNDQEIDKLFGWNSD